MMTWHFGIQTKFSRSPGKFGKHLKEVLGEERWHKYETTYSYYNAEHIWRALFNMGALFREIGTNVAKHFDYTYPLWDDEKVSTFIRAVKEMPKDADRFYFPKE
jgi:aminoglycoside 6-adenylyltransferase